MKIGMTLTLSGLIRALRWQGLEMRETKTPPKGSPGFEPVGAPARAVIRRVKARRQKDGL